MRVKSLVCDEHVCTGSWYDVAEEEEDGNIYIWDTSGEYYLMYSDEYEMDGATNILQLRETLRQAEQAYAKAQTSLDSSFVPNNSNELILAKEALKAARWNYAEACQDVVEEMIMMGELK